MNELNLNDQATIDAIKLSDVMPKIKEEAKTISKTHTFSRRFTDEEVGRLARLSSNGNWEDGLSTLIDDTISSKVGRATIRGASYANKVTKPNLRGEN